MKKLLISCLMILAMLLAACGGEELVLESSSESVSVESNTESTGESVPAENSDDGALEDARATIEELEGELADLRETLNGVNAELNGLKADKLAEEEYDVYPLGEIPGKGMLVETWLYHFDTKESEIAVYLRRYLDGKWEKLFDSPILIGTLAVSPDGTKLVFNDYDPDYMSHNYLFDLKTKKLTKLPIGDTDEIRAVSYLGWLDDRYFLYVDQENYIACMGGELRYYDTQTGKNGSLIKPDNQALKGHKKYSVLELHRVDFWGDTVLVTAMLMDNTLDGYETLSYACTVEDLYAWMEAGTYWSLQPLIPADRALEYSLGELPGRGTLVQVCRWDNTFDEYDTVVYLQSHEDGKREKLFECPIRITEFAISPDGTQMVFNDFQPEYLSGSDYALNYLYNFESGRLEQLKFYFPTLMYDESNTASRLYWLDDRYILCLREDVYVEDDGGQLMFYDTLTKEFNRLVWPDNEDMYNMDEYGNLSIHHVEVWEDRVMITAKLNGTETLFYPCSKAYLYDLIERDAYWRLQPANGD